MLIKVAVLHSADRTSGAKDFMGAEAGGQMLPREVVKSLFLEVFTLTGDVALRDMI